MPTNMVMVALLLSAVAEASEVHLIFLDYFMLAHGGSLSLALAFPLISITFLSFLSVWIVL